MVYESGHVSDQFKNTNICVDDLQKGGNFASNLHKKRRRCGTNNVNKFIGNIAKDYMETTEGGNWASNLINHLNSRFPTFIDTPKGLQDANLHQITPSYSSVFHEYENFMNLGYDYASVNNPALYEGSTYSNYNQNVSCQLGVKQTDLDLITSPEQVSSITACSYGDVISDTEAFDSSYQQQPPFHNSVYRSFTGKKRSAYKIDIPLIMVDDVQSPYQNSLNIQQNDILFENNSEKNSGKSLQIHQHVGIENTSDIFNLQVLSAYVMYKQMPEQLRNEVPFQNYMHAAECSGNNVCKCQLYAELSSHYDKCHVPNCDICGPVRALCGPAKRRKIDQSEPVGPSGTQTILDAISTNYPKLESSEVGNRFLQENVASIDQNNVITNDDMKNLTELCSEDRSLNEKIDEKELSEQVNLDSVMELEKTDIKIASLTDNDSNLEPEKTKIQSVSLANYFTAEQIKQHLSSFTSQKDVTVNIQPTIGHNTCQLCTKDKLVFAPAPIYCSSCETRIKRNVGYYRSVNETRVRHCFCMSCYRGSHGTNIIVRGFPVPKQNLQKAKNDEEKEDSWVFCDKCQCWQHRICGLYNDEKDVEGKSEYICPKCYLEEIENGKRVPLPQNTSGAKDLPRTNLSDHIEQRLAARLNQEREEMAKVSGIEPNEVPGAEGLIVRVVVSFEKQLEVRQKFIDILDGENYPSGFTYRSKLIFLFQKIEGVDVCLFGMCVQEFGSECGGPNQRCVYISYLDSVKYFRPERKCVTGESLRTFVYHEIVIGYLEYCKKRGFATCYIWACPLIKGEDYIFYCHPESQRTPKQDKLRQWYKLMLKKATEDNVVVDHTNLYNKFFVSNGEGGNNTKITAARLPYFDGDYWSGAAENIVRKLELEETSAGGLQSKLPNKRILKAMGQDKVDIAMKDVLVMQKLGQTILPVKENFMIVHLQYICTHCHEVILSGSRFFCSQCKKNQLCSRCYNADKNYSENKMHTCHSGEKKLLSEVVVNDVNLDTKNTDDTLINIYLESRDAFLNKCQKSHFQFDTLSRAKYSSMMILYHLIHKAVVKPPTCTTCHRDVTVERCWQCDICPKYYICESCYKMRRCAYHPHRLIPPSNEIVIYGSEKEQSQTQRDITLKAIMDVLMHACGCMKIPCPNEECVTMRRLFYHAARCHIRAPGGCKFCIKVWTILKEHSQICTDSDCKIPRCMDIKKYKEGKSMAGCEGNIMKSFG